MKSIPKPLFELRYLTLLIAAASLIFSFSCSRREERLKKPSPESFVLFKDRSDKVAGTGFFVRGEENLCSILTLSEVQKKGEKMFIDRNKEIKIPSDGMKVIQLAQDAGLGTQDQQSKVNPQGKPSSKVLITIPKAEYACPSLPLASTKIRVEMGQKFNIYGHEADNADNQDKKQNFASALVEIRMKKNTSDLYLDPAMSNGSAILDENRASVIAMHEYESRERHFPLFPLEADLPAIQTSDAWLEICRKSRERQDYLQAIWRCRVATEIDENNFQAWQVKAESEREKASECSQISTCPYKSEEQKSWKQVFNVLHEDGSKNQENKDVYINALLNSVIASIEMACGIDDSCKNTHKNSRVISVNFSDADSSSLGSKGANSSVHEAWEKVIKECKVSLDPKVELGGKGQLQEFRRACWYAGEGYQRELESQKMELQTQKMELQTQKMELQTQLETMKANLEKAKADVESARKELKKIKEET